MKLLLLLCLVVGTVYSGYGYGYNSERETVNGHLDFTHSSKSLNDYYPDLTSAIELPVLRYKYDWRQDGDEESLVIPLYDCTAEACNQCADGETALLVEVLDWAVVCQELPFSVSMVDQRSIGSDNDNSDEETGPLIQESTGELTGALASSSSTAVLAGLQAQNKAYNPEEDEEDGPTGRSLTGSVSTTAASTTTAETTVAPTTILPDPKSQETDSGTEASEAAPTTTTSSTSTTTTTTEAPVEGTEPTVVAAAIEPVDKKIAEASEPKEATTEASATASSTTEAADIEDEPESDVGLQDDEYTFKAKEDKSSEDDQTEEEDREEDSDEKDSQEDRDDESLFEDKETRVEEEDSKEPDQIHFETGTHSDEAAGWRAKYYTILGFFICFFIAFVIIIVFVIIKMKKKRAAPPTMIGATTGNVSPGPGLDRDFHTGDEHEPLTPAVPAGASTFKFDGTKSHTPLPR